MLNTDHYYLTLIKGIGRSLESVIAQRFLTIQNTFLRFEKEVDSPCESDSSASIVDARLLVEAISSSKVISVSTEF